MKKILLSTPLFLLFLTCISDFGTHANSESCGGTNDETVVRTGAIIYEQNGAAPAQGATVKVFKADALDGQYIFMQTTDSEGRYFLDDLQPGIFNIWVEKDSMVAFQDSVFISVNRVTLKNDTLDCSSSLSGFTAIQPHFDPGSVTIQVIGTDKHLNGVDPDGHFILKGLAGGKYSLIVNSKTIAYTPTILKVSVPNCTSDTLKDTVRVLKNDSVRRTTAMRSAPNGSAYVVPDKSNLSKLQLESTMLSNCDHSLYRSRVTNPIPESVYLTNTIQLKLP